MQHFCHPRNACNVQRAPSATHTVTLQPEFYFGKEEEAIGSQIYWVGQVECINWFVMAKKHVHDHHALTFGTIQFWDPIAKAPQFRFFCSKCSFSGTRHGSLTLGNKFLESLWVSNIEHAFDAPLTWCECLVLEFLALATAKTDISSRNGSLRPTSCHQWRSSTWRLNLCSCWLTQNVMFSFQSSLRFMEKSQMCTYQWS